MSRKQQKNLKLVTIQEPLTLRIFLAWQIWKQNEREEHLKDVKNLCVYCTLSSLSEWSIKVNMMQHIFEKHKSAVFIRHLWSFFLERSTVEKQQDSSVRFSVRNTFTERGKQLRITTTSFTSQNSQQSALIWFISVKVCFPPNILSLGNFWLNQTLRSFIHSRSSIKRSLNRILREKWIRLYRLLCSSKLQS